VDGETILPPIAGYVAFDALCARADATKPLSVVSPVLAADVSHRVAYVAAKDAARRFGRARWPHVSTAHDVVDALDALDALALDQGDDVGATDHHEGAKDRQEGTNKHRDQAEVAGKGTLVGRLAKRRDRRVRHLKGLPDGAKAPERENAVGDKARKTGTSARNARTPRRALTRPRCTGTPWLTTLMRTR